MLLMKSKRRHFLLMTKQIVEEKKQFLIHYHYQCHYLCYLRWLQPKPNFCNRLDPHWIVTFVILFSETVLYGQKNFVFAEAVGSLKSRILDISFYVSRQENSILVILWVQNRKIVCISYNAGFIFQNNNNQKVCKILCFLSQAQIPNITINMLYEFFLEAFFLLVKYQIAIDN